MMPESLPEVDHPIWGCDPSTKRIALAVLLPGGGFLSRTLHLGPSSMDPRKLASARASCVSWFSALKEDHDPGWFFCEMPFAHSNAVHPSSWFVTGAVVEAAYTAAGAVANMLTPTEWKKGAGLHGFAKKRAILDWARERGLEYDCESCGDDGSCKGSDAHDRADALGVAVAGAVLVARGVSAAQCTVGE